MSADLLQVPHQLGEGHFQRSRQAKNYSGAGIALSALQAADIVAVQVGEFSQSFLADALRLSAPIYFAPQREEVGVLAHAQPLPQRLPYSTH
jgi:hypothetical protein